MKHIAQFMILNEAFQSKLVSNMFTKGDENTKAFWKAHHDYGTALHEITDDSFTKIHVGSSKGDLDKAVPRDGKYDVMVIKGNNLKARIRVVDKGLSDRKFIVYENFTDKKKLEDILKEGDTYLIPVSLKSKSQVNAKTKEERRKRDHIESEKFQADKREARQNEANRLKAERAVTKIQGKDASGKKLKEIIEESGKKFNAKMSEELKRFMQTLESTFSEFEVFPYSRHQRRSDDSSPKAGQIAIEDVAKDIVKSFNSYSDGLKTKVGTSFDVRIRKRIEGYGYTLNSYQIEVHITDDGSINVSTDSHVDSVDTNIISVPEARKLTRTVDAKLEKAVNKFNTSSKPDEEFISNARTSSSLNLELDKYRKAFANEVKKSLKPDRRIPYSQLDAHYVASLIQKLDVKKQGKQYFYKDFQLGSTKDAILRTVLFPEEPGLIVELAKIWPETGKSFPNALKYYEEQSEKSE